MRSGRFGISGTSRAAASSAPSLRRRMPPAAAAQHLRQPQNPPPARRASNRGPPMSTPAPMQKVAALADLEEARPRRVKLGDTPILLIRSGATVHALGADCPHAGAPLEEGA